MISLDSYEAIDLSGVEEFAVCGECCKPRYGWPRFPSIPTLARAIGNLQQPQLASRTSSCPQCRTTGTDTGNGKQSYPSIPGIAV